MYGKFVYREIDAPGRLVFSSGFSNEAGEIVPAPFSEDCPREVETTVTLEPNGAGTRVTLSALPVGPTLAQSAMFASMYGGMTEGFTGTFDRLAELLASVPTMVAGS